MNMCQSKETATKKGTCHMAIHPGSTLWGGICFPAVV